MTYRAASPLDTRPEKLWSTVGKLIVQLGAKGLNRQQSYAAHGRFGRRSHFHPVFSSPLKSPGYWVSHAKVAAGFDSRSSLLRELWSAPMAKSNLSFRGSRRSQCETLSCNREQRPEKPLNDERDGLPHRRRRASDRARWKDHHGQKELRLDVQ